ncbi:MAG: type II restriction endonuclease [Roseibium album]|uniref:type II restriction endonuclease n=1 Tax=Roseibium album TaxID=311410 RepID=UPI0032ED8C56
MIARGFLSDYFEGVAVKRLSKVETSPSSSNQHEFNGSKALRDLFGDEDRKNIPTRFIWLGGEQAGVTAESVISWYDARRKHPTRTEYRLYYPANDVTVLMEEGETFFLALRRDDTAMVIFTPAGSTVQNQLLWLFSQEEEPELEFSAHEIGGNQDAELDFTVRYVLDELGIELEELESDKLDSLIERFGMKFPTTREFSALARSSLPEITVRENSDDALVAWLEREEAMFRRLERHIVSERLQNGFYEEGDADVDGFLAFSLSVQNRRKSRAGQSLENHLEAIFRGNGVTYSRGALTENRNKPDFLFPGSERYHDTDFPAERLTMLGAKLTLKDRWRQVLAEAERIDRKHLLTLEPAISEYQTEQMKGVNLQLVLPKRLHQSYRESQRKWLMTISDFIDLVHKRQKN